MPAFHLIETSGNYAKLNRCPKDLDVRRAATGNLLAFRRYIFVFIGTTSMFTRLKSLLSNEQMVVTWTDSVMM
jgi:hypothetical protein